MTARWLPGNMLAFDTETTGADPETARIVTATCVEVGPEGVVRRESWLVNPGIPIPAEATAIHGVTDVMAGGGLEPAEAVPQIVLALKSAWDRGLPVVIMCAGYDLTLLLAEVRRLEMDWPGVGPVLDPIVIDRAMEPYRPGKRRLVDLAARYKVRLDGAHSSDGDALCAARIVWRQSREWWALDKHTLTEMQEFQANAHAAWAANFEAYLRKQGKPAAISLEWPMRNHAHTRAA